MKKKPVLPLFLFFFLLLFLSLESRSEFYGYVDKDGKRHFVDSMEKIPPAYRDEVNVYREKYDHLSEEQKSIMLERDREQLERERIEQEKAYRAWEAEQKEWERELRELELRHKVEQEMLRRQRDREREVREMKRQGIQKVTIVGNPATGDAVLVPAILGYRGKEIEILLLLDTGASVIALHREIADRLHIDLKQFRRLRPRVAGGKLITAHIGKLDYVKVGPIKRENITVSIIEHEGPSVPFKGLLGMNFLRGLEYTIDFKNQLIKWNP